ncbi:hypothetical protein ARAM_006688 [Aspergillus rambellii]|uniref:Uncharacterized protein n=1 Tax=Aspergillus rambellii TaxID=308745 RepID=A0A0F8UXR6_9EURO|nr:hypothetical protein ARAM_006688 [Aspergillus rambellii]
MSANDARSSVTAKLPASGVVECDWRVSRENPHRDNGTNAIGFERRSAQMNAMQEQITALSAAVHSLRQSSVSATGPAVARSADLSGRFDLARSRLQERGIVEQTEGDVTREPSPLPTPPSCPGRRSVAEALRLCRVYEEEMGNHVPYCGPTGTPAPCAGSQLDRDDINILRLVFACALTAEASGSSELAMSFFEGVREAADNCVWGASKNKEYYATCAGSESLAILYFQIDEEPLAWRTIGIVERLCLVWSMNGKYPGLQNASNHRSIMPPVGQTLIAEGNTGPIGPLWDDT